LTYLSVLRGETLGAARELGGGQLEHPLLLLDLNVLLAAGVLQLLDLYRHQQNI